MEPLQRHKVQQGQSGHKTIRNIIAVASGKGGVGKSTVTANLAVALAQQGLRVGVLDADIYGPSQAMMMGLNQRPDSVDGKTMEPLSAHGIVFNTMAVLVDPDQPMVWRGPMASRALVQLLEETRWGELDVLLIDMPPGTGDIQLTLAQKVPVAGAVVVTTPQDIALLDARRAVKMFEKVDIPTLGIVENMATHVCSQCGHEEAIFGVGGGEHMAEALAVPLLGSLPLDMGVRLQGDIGQPLVAAEPEGSVGQAYAHMAEALLAALAERPKDFSSAFGKIAVQAPAPKKD